MSRLARPWWLRPAITPAVILARLEARSWRRTHEGAALEVELAAAGALDGLQLDEIFCRRCRRLVPVQECERAGFGLFHAPHGRRGLVAKSARGGAHGRAKRGA